MTKWQIDYMAWRPGELNSRDGGQIYGNTEEELWETYRKLKITLSYPPRYEIYSAVMIQPDGTRRWLVGG